jgi:MFS family permease
MNVDGGLSLICYSSIVFRAFQGIGGGGAFSMVTIIIIELVPPAKYPKYMAGIAMVAGVAWLIGPIVGGAFSTGTLWRWVFLVKYVSFAFQIHWPKSDVVQCPYWSSAITSSTICNSQWFSTTWSIKWPSNQSSGASTPVRAQAIGCLWGCSHHLVNSSHDGRICRG